MDTIHIVYRPGPSQLNTCTMRSYHTFHKLFAWIPTRLTNGRLIWLQRYYITPNASGYGDVISHSEYLTRQL